MKKQIEKLPVWMEVKIILAPEDYKFLQRQALQKSLMLSDLTRQIILRYIGNERGSV
ncbi:MAG TPA: hypothetical protein PLY88_05515 [Candidatus Omnitrophota bacterium]|nr:hypothetical protein [Candidatus Omnitrophota bacterium]